MGRRIVNQLAHGLRRVRYEYGLSMTEMARLLDVNVATVSRIESGRLLATYWRPEDVASDLGVPVDELLRPCPRCRYAPPVGFMCMRCGTGNPLVTGRG